MQKLGRNAGKLEAGHDPPPALATSGIKDFINEPTASLRLDVSEQDVWTPRPRA